jgi:hypothetical protein
MRDTYPNPVDELLEIGEPTGGDWLDYGRLGIGPEHLAPLLMMVNDSRLAASVDPELPAAWGPVHALRAVAELRDPRALEPLLAVLTANHADDWLSESALAALVMLGGDAVAACAPFLLNPGQPEHARCTVIDALATIAEVDAAAAPHCVDALAALLRRPDWLTPFVASFAVASLAELRATEHLGLAREIFDAGLVDPVDFTSWDGVVEEFHRGPDDLGPMLRTVEGRTEPIDAPVYRLRVTLRDVTPPVWREIEIAGDATLCRLHHVIQQAFGWLTCHLYDFHTPQGRFADLRRVKEPEGARDVRTARLTEVAPEAPTCLVYVYDFGDEWVHEVDVVAIDAPPADRRALPRCTAGERATPPEDCGGSHGYDDLLAALADPRHEEHESSREWAGDFDPERFDLADVNRRMRGPDWR